MKTNPLNRLLTLGLALATFTAAAQYYGVDEPNMGLYEGVWSAGNKKGALTAQIRSLGDTAYDGFLLLNQDGQPPIIIKVATPKEPDTNAIALNGSVRGGAKLEAKARMKDGSLNGALTGELGEGKFEAKKIVKQSLTLGAKPPAGAYYLFDGKDTSQFKKFGWKLVDGDAMEVKGGDMFFKGDHKDFKLHLEFRTPFMPKATGQARGNSGVYLQCMYETQVLDSFGLYPLQNNDCGSIYSVKTAPGNACLPPMQWQTYDITYRDGDGTTNNPPAITVLHNGVLTIENAKIPGPMIGKGGTAGTPGGGMLKLQDHGNPVQYRNIWLQPLK